MAIPVLLALMVASAWWQRRPRVQNPVSEAPPVRRLITGKAVKPAPAPQGYVGSQACAKCHASIAESYAAHPMYRSAGATPGSDDLEDFVNTEFKSPDGRIYRVAKEDDGIYHHELLLDNDGELLYDEAAKISFFIGSGTLGKSYAIDRGGILFQSPISWYASDKKWDLSPGYSRRHPRFGRRILDHCVICHAGRPNLDPDRDNCFVEPVLIEAAIGCERCHGPGERHIALHETPGLAQSDDPIVNPARLDHDRREAVCYQCHLIGKMRFARYGRTFDDFRPGDRLDDVWTTLVEGTGVRSDGKTKAVSHVQQMRDSTCFKKSEGRLGCTSCHDPHSVPAAGEASAYFRQRCLECHADQGCSLPAEQQAAAPANDSCAYCHMPRLSAHDVAHASQTDHRILRLQETDDRDLHPPSERETLVVFDEEHTSMPAWELERAKALAKATQIEEAGYASAAMADELQQTLQMIVDIAPDDFRALSALAGTEEVRLNHALARDTWQRALELRPDDETMLDVLASVCQTMGDFQAGLDYSDRLIELNPWRSGDYLRRAIMLSQFGRWPEATADGEMAVKLDPSDKHARRWLSEAYERLGNLEASRRHADVLKRMSALTVAP
ncbi:MAG TPA: cytochrome c3 family protein [Pirellulales bacterium]|nr:cytochrome c3 family protein [Pirellulales bacterium]